MADYAQVENGRVVDIIVTESHSAEAEAWLEANVGGDWVPCNIEGEPNSLAAVGAEYDIETGQFIPVPEFESWTFNRETWSWEAPEPMPQDGIKYQWDEDTLSWKEPPALLDS